MIYLSGILRKKQIKMKSIVLSLNTILKSTVGSHFAELLIPKILNNTLSITSMETTEAVLNLFPNIVMNIAVHNDSFQLLAGGLAKQKISHWKKHTRENCLTILSI